MRERSRASVCLREWVWVCATTATLIGAAWVPAYKAALTARGAAPAAVAAVAFVAVSVVLVAVAVVSAAVAVVLFCSVPPRQRPQVDVLEVVNVRGQCVAAAQGPQHVEADLVPLLRQQACLEHALEALR